LSRILDSDGARAMRELLLARWTEIGAKLVAMADEFPADRYDARPVDGVRTFADQLRHVAFWNRYALGKMRGESPDDAANELPRAEYSTKARIRRALGESVDAVAAELATGGEPSAAVADTVVSFIEHGAEHYGQLVVYCRLSGIVPPASRD
jgi:uncharacterized damage-inducible protein DinB